MSTRRGDRYLEQEFMRPDGTTTPPKNTSAVLDRRDAERVLLSSHVAYSSDGQAGASSEKGQLVNLSIKGCRVVGPALVVGSRTTLSLDLQDGKPALTIAGAMVCWNEGDSFGLKFPTMPVEDRQRLQKRVLKLVTLRGTSEEHTAFRFA